jgi:uncharacterized protein
MTKPSSGRTVLVFARAPEPGRVKTRLAAAVGGERATAIYRDLAEHTVNVARQVTDCRVVVCCDPPGSVDAIAAWLGSGVEYRAQLGGDLGMRMAGAMGDALAGGAQSVALIGTDCPGLDAALIDAAFAAIDPRAGASMADVALGPARDGGYYLIAARQVHPALFGGIPWSTSETLGATLSAAAAAGLRVSLLDTRRDIDTIEDWLAWCAERSERGESDGYIAASDSGAPPSR